jgi:acetyltransferase-like isoleucine patch superfamily enzyme
VIHEIGHILGINSDPFVGYWDISPLQLGGATVRVRANLDDSGHLADEFALMCKGCGGPGIRRLPSAVDILAIDADEGPIEEVDLPRKQFLGGSWTNGPSWLGGRVPGSSDTAFVRNSSHLSLSTASVTVGNLFIDEGTEVYVHQDVTLSVLDTLALNSTEGFLQSEITVLNDGLLAIEDFQINGGKLDVSLGGVASIDGTLTVDNGGGFTGEIFGQGLVEIRSRLVNNGSIIADSTIFPLEFAYSGFSSKVLDLDGDNSPEDGVLDAMYGRLLFNAVLTDDFDGTMILGANGEITMNNDWTLGIDGRLEIWGHSSLVSAPEINGEAMTIKGMIIVEDDAGALAAPVMFAPTATVLVYEDQHQLLLNGPTTFRGGSYYGYGVLHQRGFASVEADTKIDVDFYDWDGDDTSPSTTEIMPGVSFTIDSRYIDVEDGGYDGTILNQGGILAVYAFGVPWRLDVGGSLQLNNGSIRLERPTGPSAYVRGSPMDVHGRITARKADNRIQTDVTFRRSAQVQTLLVEDELYLEGTTEYQGGSYTGDGTIHQNGDANVVDCTRIDVATYDWDGDNSNPSTSWISPTGLLWIRSDRIDSEGDGYDGKIQIDGGTLIVNTGASALLPWRLDEPSGTIEMMDGAVLSGGARSIAPSTPTLPPCSADALTPEALGSTMLVAGNINVSGRDNLIYARTEFESSASVHVDSGSSLIMAGPTIYSGGDYRGDGVIVQRGIAGVHPATTISVNTFDMENTVWTLGDNLVLNVEKISSSPGNLFAGTINVNNNAKLEMYLTSAMPQWILDGGQINVGDPTIRGSENATFKVIGADLLMLNGNVHVSSVNNLLQFFPHVSGIATFTGDGTVEFLGGFSPGTSLGVVGFNGNVSFGPANTLFMEIGTIFGIPITDQLVVNGDISLAGVLKVIFIDGFAPTLGDTYDLLHVSGNVQGDFSEINVVNVVPGFQYTTGWDGQVFRLTALTNGEYMEDIDGDGISDSDETNCGSDPLNALSTCEVCDEVDNDLDGTVDEGYTDTDNDGTADCVDPDDDNDGVDDPLDSEPLNRFACQDSDADSCDDCSVAGSNQSNNDGIDTDADGLCDVGDPDDDNDGVDDALDSEPLNQFACQDSDADSCDDCSVAGSNQVNNDGIDTDADGLCDVGDPDDDNDGVDDALDSEPLNQFACQDSDADSCDDCSVAGSPQVNNDGIDTDADGLCDVGDVCPLDGDNDADGDGVCGDVDNCPTVPNNDQLDINGDGHGDACVAPDVNIPDSSSFGDNPVIGTGSEIKQDMSVGDNAVIGSFVTMNKNIEAGDNLTVGDGSIILKDVTIGDNVEIGSNVTIKKEVVIGSNVTIGDGTIIGIGTIIGNNVTIGQGVVIGNGVIIMDGTVIPDGTVISNSATVP